MNFIITINVLVLTLTIADTQNPQNQKTSNGPPYNVKQINNTGMVFEVVGNAQFCVNIMTEYTYVEAPIYDQH